MWICDNCGNEIYIDMEISYTIDKIGDPIDSVGEDFIKYRCSNCSSEGSHAGSIATWKE